MAMQLLNDNNFTCVFNMDGGTKQWHRVGYDVEKGPWTGDHKQAVVDACTNSESTPSSAHARSVPFLGLLVGFLASSLRFLLWRP
mmetsp:Transcript_2334/g.3750  ORF Transcript_2334/g.3750 Transcript_2334/m.3750 type:complete len:85 (+) Transcript_2334:445-699(+)